MKTYILSLIFAVTSFSVIAQGGVIINEPSKPQYYFSDGHPPSYYNGNINLPVIFTNQPRYDATNDIVWMRNDKIKIGINLKRGGQLAWASKANATTNLIYNGYDGGFQVTIDSYERQDRYSQNGKYSRARYDDVLQYDGVTVSPTNPFTSYNVTQGGDFLNHAVSLIDYHPITDGYYVKFRPIFYTLNSELSQTFIEAKYTIISNSVKIEYRYTSFRTDGQWNGSGFDGAAAPACFIVNTLNKYKTYTGSSPWTNGSLTGGNLPNQSSGQSPVDANSTEFWGMVYDDQHPESGIGVYSDNEGGNKQYFQFKQLEVYQGNPPGTEFGGGFTYFHAFTNFDIPSSSRGNYVKDIVCYLMVGSESEIRNRATEIHQGSGCSCTSPTPAITASPANGVPTTLTASGCSGMVTWGDGTTGSTKSVSSAGTYSATCTNSGCCISNNGSITISGGPGGVCVVNKVKLAYRGGENNNGCCFERLIGCKIQGSNNNSTWTDLYTFSSAGNGTLQEFTFANNTSYSYVRFQAGANSWGELSQLEFYNNANRLNGTGFGTESFARALDNDPYTGWHASASPGPQNVAGLQLTGCTGGCTNPPSAPSITSNATTAPATLTASGCSGTITWNDNATGTTKYVSVAGTYSATCTTTGCPVSAAGSITISNLPPSNKCPYQDAQGWHYWSFAENKFKDGNYFAWDAANSRILYALNGSQGLYASLNPNPGGQALTLQQLRDAGVSEEIVACFNGGGCSCTSPTPSIAASPTSGVPATLTASGCNGTITWGDGTTGNTKSVSSAGTYTAKCTNTGCCVSAASSITINTTTSSKCPYQDAQGWHYWSFAENKFKDGNWFAWDAANSRILFVLNGSQGLYASLSPNPGGQVLNRQQLRDAGVSEEIIPCFSNGQSRIGVVSNEKDVTTTVYPNPTEGKITIDFYLENDESVWLNFYNSQGRNMDIKNIQANKGYNSFELDIKSYPAGSYFVNLQSSQKSEVIKVMKIN